MGHGLSSACHVTSLGVDRLPSALDAQLKQRLSESHQWDGAAALDGTVPVLAFKLSQESAFLADLPDENRKFFPWGWCLEFGAVVTVMAVGGVQFKYPSPIVFLYADSEVLDYLDGGKFNAVFYRDDQAAAYCEVSFSDEAGGLSGFRAHINAVRNHREALRDCKKALFWQVIHALRDHYAQFLSPEDRLSMGWQRWYTVIVKWFAEERDIILKGCDFSRYRSADLPDQLVQFFDACLPSRFDIEDVSTSAVAAYKSMNTLVPFFTCTQKVESFAGKPADLKTPINELVIQLGLHDPDVTACGTRIPWLSLHDDALRFFEPAPRGFPKWFAPEDYWERLPVLLPCFALGDLVSPSDVPVDLVDRQRALFRLNFPRAEKPAEAVGVADSLIEEALANKHWVIPNRALVQLPIGPFTHFEVTELAKQVFFVGRTERGEFGIIGFDMKCKGLLFQQADKFQVEHKSHYDEIYAALKLTLAAVIRDFWVVEERERVFAQKSAKKVPGVRIKTNEDGSPRIVYLPRIRYKKKPDPESCATALEHKARAAHFVQAHLRRVGQASDAQIILAQRYGFSVPEGHTFVRPHERGKGLRPVIYRSRSVLQSLYRIDETLPPGKAEWFQFEKDAETLMKRLGFEVQHRAAARRGDKGVDLYATKGADLDCVNWVIQCKCYHPNHKIGPDKVRELHGVVSTYPAGTRGMIVTTSSFTAGAASLAVELNIRLMDGSEFGQRIR